MLIENCNCAFIYSIEKEQQDNTQKLKDSQEAGQKVLELQRKLDHAREVVSFECLVIFVFWGICFACPLLGKDSP